jgi:hypothetical protein
VIRIQILTVYGIKTKGRAKGRVISN